MANVNATDVLYAQQAPEKLAEVSGLSVNEAFYIKQDAYSVANKLGVKAVEVADNEAGSYELASKMSD